MEEESLEDVPIMIGATGDKMMEMTGEIADGAVLNYCVPPEYNIKALELLEIGAKKSGRTLDDIDRPQLIVCSVDDDHDIAIETYKRTLDTISCTATTYCQSFWCFNGCGCRNPIYSWLAGHS